MMKPVNICEKHPALLLKKRQSGKYCTRQAGYLNLHNKTILQLMHKKSIRIIEGMRGKFTIEEYKSRYINDKIKVYDRLIRILLESGDGASAFSYSERARARAFLDMIENRKWCKKHH